ncbi:uncharacterized protein [Littorina saxatilis]|uniref:uncharacterized protein n=1 Tax=Littorina saxatilis TaxID=31220 RepID=UPI0038B52DB9
MAFASANDLFSFLRSQSVIKDVISDTDSSIELNAPAEAPVPAPNEALFEAPDGSSTPRSDLSDIIPASPLEQENMLIMNEASSRCSSGYRTDDFSDDLFSSGMDVSDSPESVEYIPSTDSDSESSDSVVYPQLTTRNSTVHQNSGTLNDQDHCRSLNETEQEETVVVQCSNGKKKWYCLHCHKAQSVLPRHLRDVHGEEQDVQEYMNCKEPKQKELLLMRLRNMGNHLHNVEVLKQGKGELIVCHRPSDAKVCAKDFGPCLLCYGYYKTSLLYKHKCPLETKPSLKGIAKVKHSKLLLPMKWNESDSQAFLLFLGSVRKDEIGMVATHDSLIVELARCEFDTHGHNPDQHEYARSRIREMARLLIDLRKNTEKGSEDPKKAARYSLTEFITPEEIQSIVASARNVCGYNHTTQEFDSPSLATKIGISLKKCARLLQAKAIERRDKETETNAVQFLQVMNMTWNRKINHHAGRTLVKKKRNKIQLLPVTEDIVRFSRFLKEEATKCVERLESTETPLATTTETWSRLNEILLSQCILFNRRRQGEVSKMKVGDYKAGLTNQSPAEEDVLKMISPFERELCQNLMRIEVEGKRGRTVPVLLSRAMKHSLDILLASRDKAGISRENQFLFPRTHYQSKGHIRGTDCLRDLAQESGIKHPELVRSTKLRKQIATITQVVNLQDNELDVLASFLGHDVRVHREYYRLPEHTLQVAKVAKLLIAMETGEISCMKGKTLDDITVRADEGLVEEDSSASASEDEAATSARGRKLGNAGLDNESSLESEHLLGRDGEDLEDYKLHPSCSGNQSKPDHNSILNLVLIGFCGLLDRK